MLACVALHTLLLQSLGQFLVSLYEVRRRDHDKAHKLTVIYITGGVFTSRASWRWCFFCTFRLRFAIR